MTSCNREITVTNNMLILIKYEVNIRCGLNIEVYSKRCDNIDIQHYYYMLHCVYGSNANMRLQDVVYICYAIQSTEICFAASYNGQVEPCGERAW